MNWLMVGSAEQTNQFCGTYFTIECPSHEPGHLNEQHENSCHKVVCPICYNGRIDEMAHVDLDRLRQVRRAYYLEGIKLELCEIIVSPPKHLYSSFYDKKEYDKVRDQALAIAEAAGSVGGFLVVHQYRGRSDVMEKIRTGEIQKPDAWHFHFVALRHPTYVQDPRGRWQLNPKIEKSKSINKRTAQPGDQPGPKGGYPTGWTYKHVSEYTKTGHRRNWYKKVRYELDHAAIYKKDGRHGQINGWVGICSRRAVKRTVKIEEEPVLCPICKRQAAKYIDGIYKDDAVLRRTHYHYHIKDEVIEKSITRYKLEQGATRSEVLELELEDQQPGDPDGTVTFRGQKDICEY